MTSLRLNKWNGAQKEKYSASSNIKLSLTDELETRSCFITSPLQSSSAPLSLGIWEHCPYAPLTLTTGFFSRKDRNRLWALMIQCQDAACVATPALDKQRYLKKESKWSFSLSWVKKFGFNLEVQGKTNAKLVEIIASWLAVICQQEKVFQKDEVSCQLNLILIREL